MSQYALVKTKLASKPLGIIVLSFLLILKVFLKIRRKSTSNKREFFLTPEGVSITRNRNALKGSEQ